MRKRLAIIVPLALMGIYFVIVFMSMTFKQYIETVWYHIPAIAAWLLILISYIREQRMKAISSRKLKGDQKSAYIEER